jgi:hypothetical protein
VAKAVSSWPDLLPSGDSRATLNTGWLAGSKREMRASLTSSRSSGLTSATFSRTSSAALRPSTSSLNCTTTSELPSYERENIESMPATVLTASSTFFVTSASTISGDAPG